MVFYSQQNKQRGSALVIVLAIAAVLATGGAIAYVLLSKDKDGGVDLSNIGHKTITATTSEDVKTLLAKAKAGEYDAKCTYTDESGEGTLYIKEAARLRVDTTISNKPAHVVRLDDAVYIWADGQSEGSKFPVSTENKESKYSPDSFASKVDQYKVKCQSVGNLSDSLFTLPTNVNFVDVNSRLKTYPTDLPGHD